MNRFVKLVHMEISRFWKLYAALFVITVLTQGAGVFFQARAYMNARNRDMETELLTDAQYIIKYGSHSFYNLLMDTSFWFIAPIALSAAALLLYTVFIWYREWMGKNSFIYRLLMIPTARRNIYLAKLTAIMLLVFGLVAFQLVILPIEKLIYDWMIPSGLSEPMTILELIHYYPPFLILTPNNFIDFMLIYGLGLTFVIIIFTVILLERSYRLKGFLAGLLYLLVIGLIMLIPLFTLANQMKSYLYPVELASMELILALVIGLLSAWLGLYLVKNKVTV
ncbi:hypothetical protein Back11_25530 [Paenibacillus baekrokdamisoli]|uniref:Uncharacterized protein n=1 Tax=Paenibacillus baekrokdamisoli TaxID=1712516 RepID=A0A3G9JBG8_9BACL|nr:hypothetical protein [Paenibacillus baekrokdamisoli]MBB3070202.1 hypothetical protein [Paenibacillus baekrokdamisoli]BBH21208.1 hypothetical protein Back11_25530 [Paenibacillus baekrokdamisoli]